MLTMTMATATDTKRVFSDDQPVDLTYVFHPARDEGRDVHLVEFDVPGGVFRPHFHLVDQFQIVVTGKGRLGKHALAPLTVHYTDASTPYGPIVVDGPGLSFFTVRLEPMPGPGIHYVPQDRKMLPEQHGRNISAHPPEALDESALESGALDVHELIAEHEDGLRVDLIRLGSAAIHPVTLPSASVGHYVLVVAGDITAPDELPLWSCIYLAPSDSPPTLVAGHQGAQVLVLSFPTRRP